MRGCNSPAPSYTFVRLATTLDGCTATLSLRARGCGRAGRLLVRDRSDPVCGDPAVVDDRRDDAEPDLYRPGAVGEGCGGSGLRMGDTLGERDVVGLTAFGSGTENSVERDEEDVEERLSGGGASERREAAGLVGRPRGIWDLRIGDVRGEPFGGMSGSLLTGFVSDSACGGVGGGEGVPKSPGGVGSSARVLTVPDRVRPRGEFDDEKFGEMRGGVTSGELGLASV